MSAVSETVAAPAEPVHSERWQPTVSGWVARLVVLVVIFGGVLYLTATVPGFWADRISLAVIYAIIGLSLNMVLGYVGQVSLGHHGFVGISAFVAAWYVTEKAGCTLEAGCGLTDFFTGIVLATLAGGASALLLGLVALRIKGLYLALITLAYGFMAERSIFEIPALTRGGAGMPAPRPKGFTSDTEFAFLCMVFLVVVLWIDWRFIRSKVGRAVLSIKHSEPVASSYGINVTSYKTMAFILSGMFAGMAGGLYAFRNLNVVSNDFRFELALLWVLMVVVGGLGNRVGVVIGSAFFALFPFLLEAIKPIHAWAEDFGRDLSTFGLILGSALAILTIIQFQGGIGEQISPITRWLGGKKFSMHPEGHGHAPKSGGKKDALLAKVGLTKKADPKEEATAEPTSPDEKDES
jgi:branched-chain amino acid transport system permease protein